MSSTLEGGTSKQSSTVGTSKLEVELVLNPISTPQINVKKNRFDNFITKYFKRAHSIADGKPCANGSLGILFSLWGLCF